MMSKNATTLKGIGLKAKRRPQTKKKARENGTKRKDKESLAIGEGI